MNSGRNKIPSSPGKCSRILVTGIASSTSEETLRDFFAFCGEISMLHLYSTENSKKEAVIKFTTESAANTACLLTNALVDGSSLKIELFPSNDEKGKSGFSRDSTPTESVGSAATNDSFTSIFSGIASTGRVWASSMASKVKAFDQQYKVSDTVISGATTAWSESKKLASDLNTKYHVSESVSSAVKSTKEKVLGPSGRPATPSSTTSPGGSGREPTGSSPSGQPGVPLNRSTSPSKFN